MNRIDDYLAKLKAVGASDLLLSSERPPLYRAAKELLPLPGEGPISDGELRIALSRFITEDEWAGLLAERQLEFVIERTDHRLRGICALSGATLSARLSFLRAAPSLAELQPPAALAALTDADAGLIIVTGPSASGKSTLIASMLTAILQQRVLHAVTIEDPVEQLYAAPNAAISQRAVRRHCGDFAHAVDAALAADADVIACSALHAPGAFERLVEAASSGVLVLAELPGRGTVSVLEQLLLGAPAAQRAQLSNDLGDNLLAAVSLDLVPRKAGGRTVAVELLLSTPNVASLLRDGKTTMLAGTLDREPGMQSMDRCLLDLATRGIIDGRDAYSRALDKRAFAAWA